MSMLGASDLMKGLLGQLHDADSLPRLAAANALKSLAPPNSTQDALAVRSAAPHTSASAEAPCHTHQHQQKRRATHISISRSAAPHTSASAEAPRHTHQHQQKLSVTQHDTIQRFVV